MEADGTTRVDKPVFSYWKMRALGQPIRYLLEYTRTDYIEQSYIYTPDINFLWAQWLKNMGRGAHPQILRLPQYKDGKVKINSVTDIMQYIATKNDLRGKSDEEISLVYHLHNLAFTTRVDFANFCYSINYPLLKDRFIQQTLPVKLRQISEALQERAWFSESGITYADFSFFETLDVFVAFAPDCLAEFECLQSFMERFLALEEILNYRRSSRFIDGPLHGPSAYF